MLDSCKEYIRLCLRIEELKPLVIDELRSIPSGIVETEDYTLSYGLTNGWWRFSDDLFEAIAEIEKKKDIEIKMGIARKYNQTNQVKFKKKKEANTYKQWVDGEVKKIKVSKGFDTSKK